jgi:hypothetical protein
LRDEAHVTIKSLRLFVPFVVFLGIAQSARAYTSAPSLSTGTGTYYAPFNVTIADFTAGAIIYYTTDGTVPTTSSNVYSGPLLISSTTTLNAIAVAADSTSTVKSATYSVTVPLSPSFNTGTGTYYAPPAITISDGTNGAVIYYTTDGTTPTTSSRVYLSPLLMSSTTTLNAVAVYPGGSPSAVTTATYTVSSALAPTFSTGTGTYYAPFTVTIHEATSGAVVYYTTNGTTPTTSSAVYTNPMPIGSTTTLEAIAVYPGGSSSSVQSAIYTVTVPLTPTFSTGTGTYYAPFNVTIESGTNGAVVYYTTNGTTPTTSSPVYTGGTISILATTHVGGHRRLSERNIERRWDSDLYFFFRTNADIQHRDGHILHTVHGNDRKWNCRRNCVLHNEWNDADDFVDDL